jgi:hypothetical protein
MLILDLQGEAKFCVNTLRTLEARFGTRCVLSEKVVILTPYRRQAVEKLQKYQHCLKLNLLHTLEYNVHQNATPINV